MDIGRMKHRITIQKYIESKNEYGEVIKNWVDFKTVWASVEPILGRKFFMAETVNSEITHEITMRYIPGVKTNMRVKFKDRIFEQKAPPINVRESNKELKLMCKELF